MCRKTISVALRKLVLVFSLSVLTACGSGSSENVNVQQQQQEQEQETRSNFPDYNKNPQSPELSGMEKTAQEIASEIKLGWNIGNTMEAIGGETAWGNPEVSQALIEKVKQSGFDAVRIPIAWDQYSNQDTAEISAQWLGAVYLSSTNFVLTERFQIAARGL